MAGFIAAADANAGTCQEALHRGEPSFFPADVLKAEAINYKTYGSPGPGKRVIVLVHGLGGSLRTWDQIGPALAQDAYVIVPDSRGHGDTAYTGDRFSSTMMAADIASLLKSLGVAKASLIGHSMGGRTVVRFAQQYPEMSDRIVVEDMHMKGRSKLQPDKLDLARRLRDIPKTFDSIGDIYNALSPFFGNDYVRDEIVPHFVSQNADGKFALSYNLNREAAYRLYEAQGLQEDLTSPLRDVAAPMLFIAATKDPVLFGIGLDHLKATRPDAKIVAIEAGHGVHYDAPDAYLMAVRSFFAAPIEPH